MSGKPPEMQADTQAIPHWYSPKSETPTIIDGEGATVYDDEGKEYLDFVSQLYCCNAGHDNEAIIDAMEEQARRIPYVSSAKHNDTRSELARKLAEIAPGSLSDVYFSISGSEANESAIQIARDVQDAPKVLTRWQSYHGGTYGAGGLTGDPSTRATVERFAATTGTGKFLPPLPKAFDADSPRELAEMAADHVEFVIQNEGPDSVAAILTEPIGGTSGAYPAPPGYFERLREICDQYDILLISDEVITGFGRCGDWFGISTEDVDPDMITFAKGVTSAYVPLAGVIVDEGIGQHVQENGHELGQTFAGHPVACAAGCAALKEYDDGLIANVREHEPYLEERLRELEASHGVVSEVRGRGFLWSVVFADPVTDDPFVHPWVDHDSDNPVADVRKEATDRGIMFGSGRPDVQVLVAPPFSVGQVEIDEAIEVLDTAIETVFG
ncbi:aspartate aminotransferase family protein [Halomarina halobia]|uniref:Aspartate aminotransferase family protein n=1 Tax=Halomarina halobia TaxID=3033386 RepID=A0ABD6AG59_9EURY|nr:aminotransferase class III-fold pyridoxal phosphate-dependent enzyme [Halomarina sp. PSR21]